MSHTKSLTYPENDFFIFGLGNTSEVKLCPVCKGQGAKMSNDRLESVEMCYVCKYTGRLK